jgi:hypothetical protein
LHVPLRAQAVTVQAAFGNVRPELAGDLGLPGLGGVADAAESEPYLGALPRPVGLALARVGSGGALAALKVPIQRDVPWLAVLADPRARSPSAPQLTLSASARSCWLQSLWSAGMRPSRMRSASWLRSRTHSSIRDVGLSTGRSLNHSSVTKDHGGPSAVCSAPPEVQTCRRC